MNSRKPYVGDTRERFNYEEFTKEKDENLGFRFEDRGYK